jgi:signal transduction histidine kinase/PAS domain-containing protein
MENNSQSTITPSVERKALLNDVCQGILKPRYYSILGPKQIGKTTFLKQIKNRIEKEHKMFKCVYIDLGEVKTANSRLFYSDLVQNIFKELDGKSPGPVESKQDFNRFFTSLLKSTNQNITLLLDEIEHIPEYITRDLLEIFRVFHQAMQRQPFYKKLAVIISGSTNLLEFTMGQPNSPFNIAHPLLLSDLEYGEGSELIDKIMIQNKIRVDSPAKQIIMKETNGHPYLISKLCLLCTGKANKEVVKKKQVEESIEELVDNYKNDEFFSFIIKKVENDLDIFETYIKILDKGHAPQKDLEITIGKYELSGAFLKEKNVFKIRNKVINRLLSNYFDNVRKGDVFIMLGKWIEALELYKKEKQYQRMKRRRQDTLTSSRRRTIDIIKAIGNLMYSPKLKTEQIFDLLLNGIHYVLSYDSVYLFTLNKEKNCLSLKDFRGSKVFKEIIEIENFSRVLEVRAYNAQKYVVEDKNERNNFAVAYPLKLSESTVEWVLSINNYESRLHIKDFDCEELKTLANEALLAIKNARNYYNLSREYYKLYKENYAILEAMGEELSIVDENFDILYMNKEKIRVIGKDYSGTGEKCYKIFAMRETRCYPCPCMDAMKDGKIVRRTDYQVEYHKDNKEHFVIQTASPLKDEDGRCTRAVKVVRDVTMQKKLFDIIEKLQQEQNLNKIISFIMDGIVELGYKRVRFYDYIKDEHKNEFVVGRDSRGMEDVKITFSGYRINFKDITYLNDTVEKNKPDFYFGDTNNPLLKKKKWLNDLQLKNVKWMDLPLISSQKKIGFIGIDNQSKGDEFTNEDLDIMAILAGYAAQAIENSRYFKRQKILYDVSKKITGTLDIEELQKDIVKTICETLQTEMCSILIFDEDQNMLVRKATYLNTKEGWTNHIDFEEFYKISTYICGKVYQDGIPRIINDIPNFKDPKNIFFIKKYENLLKSGRVNNAVFAPLTYKGDKIGIIRTSNKLSENGLLSEIGFRQEEQNLLVSLGEQIAIVLANSKMYEERRLQLMGLEALNHVISMITSAVDLKEIYIALEEIKNIFPNIDEMCLLIKEDDDYTPVINCPNKDTPECENCKKQERECIKKDDSYKPYYCPDIKEDEYFEKAIKTNLKSRFIIPLVFENELLGIFDIGSKNIEAFSEFDRKLFTSLGSQIAIALNNRIKQDKQLQIFKDVSHSLGTYLTTMRGYTQRLIEGKVETEEKRNEYLKRLLVDVLAHSNSVDEISSLANMEYGQINFEMKRVNVSDVVETVCRKNDFLLKDKNLDLNISVTEEKIFVKGDKKKLEEALQSLMNNAIKFSEKNKTIHISILSDSDAVLIKIKDQGYGIHKEDWERIFKKYERGKNAREREIEGTGIGLATARNIIEKHSGEIIVEESQLNIGSTFTVKLPFYKEGDK